MHINQIKIAEEIVEYDKKFTDSYFAWERSSHLKYNLNINSRLNERSAYALHKLSYEHRNNNSNKRDLQLYLHLPLSGKDHQHLETGLRF